VPSRGHTDSSREEDELSEELKSCASKLDWRQPERFRFSTTPDLKKLLQLEDSKESVERFHDLLVKIRAEEEAREQRDELLYGRSLARAWTVLLRLDKEWYGQYLTPRRLNLIDTWHSKRGEKIRSEDGFRRHQEPYIYTELAERLRASAEQAKPKPQQSGPSGPSVPSRRSAPSRTAWPVRGHEPHDDQEIVILVAARAMRTGPGSGLVKLVREFEPYWRATGAMLYALEGSYRDIWRAGLLHDYEYFAPLIAGSEGGLVHATEVVIAAASAKLARRTHVVFLIDPHDSSSLYPASASLKRECLLTRTPFLTSDRGAARWFRLEWARRVTESESGVARELVLSPPKSGFSDGSPLREADEVLALAAHDRHKLAMMEFAEAHEALIDRRFPTRWATQATGHVLNGGLLSEGEYQNRVLSDEGERQREELRETIDKKVSVWNEERRTIGPGSSDWIPQLTFGRQGGVIQLAGKVIKDECDTILFFQDAETAREHDTEIQVLDRAAQLAGSNCLLLHDATSANRWAENLEICLDRRRTSTPTTLTEAYRKIFEVELVLVPSATGGRRQRPSEKENQTSLWGRITAAAALHIVGALRAAAARRTERDEPVRFGFPWGGAIRDILGQESPDDDGQGSDRRALAGALGLQYFVDRRDTKELHQSGGAPENGWPPPPGTNRFFRPDELRVVPTVGVMGALDRSLEAHSLVERAVQILGGEGVLYPESAFALAKGNRDPWGGAPQNDWENLDVLLLSATPLQDRAETGPEAMATGLPPDLAAALGQCKGAVGTIYLEEHDGEVRQPKYDPYRHVGLDISQIKKLKARSAEVILVNGAEENVERCEAAWAALKAGLATTFVTDQSFAWDVMEKELSQLKPSRRGR
jgi:methylglyoxal synthase